MLLYPILLTAADTLDIDTEVVEEVVDETSHVLTLTPQQIKLGILALVIVGLAVYFIVKPTPEKTNSAKAFLNSLGSQIMAIILAEIDYRINTYDGTIDLSFDDFKKKLLDTIYDESWDFVQKAIEKAVDEGKLNSIAAKFIKKESVESLVNIIVGRDNIQQKIVEAFNILFDKYNSQMLQEEQADVAFAEQCENEPLDEDDEPIPDEYVEAFIGNSENDDYNEIDLSDIEENIEVSDEAMTEIDVDAPEDDTHAVG